MKLKENKGMSLIVFTVIVVILLIVSIGVIVYLLNNPVKDETTIQTPTNVEDLNFSNEVQVKLSNEEALTKGNELYEKVYLYVINSPKKENIESKLTLNAKQQIENIKKSENELMTSIFNSTDVGRKEVKVKEIKNDEVIFDILHYSVIETDGQEERLEYTFENAFKIVKLNSEWVIDSVIGKRVENNQIITKELSSKEKSNINTKLSRLCSISYADEMWKNTNKDILNSEKAKYQFIVLLSDFPEDDITHISNGYILDPYLKVSKFQEYAKQYYNKELNIDNLKEYLKTKDGETYILVTLGGLAADDAIKADYIIENKIENTKSLYVNVINLYENNLTSEEINNYQKDSYLEYDKSKISYSLKINYKTNPETNENYIISIEKI